MTILGALVFKPDLKEAKRNRYYLIKQKEQFTCDKGLQVTKVIVNNTQFFDKWDGNYVAGDEGSKNSELHQKGVTRLFILVKYSSN